MPLSDLILELERLSVRPHFGAAWREEFESGGMTTGRFAIGDVNVEPTMVYLLWHGSGEAPVSMLTTREGLTNEAGTRAAARAFLVKWKECLGRR